MDGSTTASFEERLPAGVPAMDAHALAGLGWYKTVCEGLDRLGLDGAALCVQAGVHTAVLEKQPDGVLGDALALVFEQAVAQTGDPCLGLRMACHPLSSLGVLSHMLLSSPNMRKNLRLLVRYLPLFWPMAMVELKTVAGRTVFTLDVKRARRQVPAAMFDFFVTMVLSGFRVITGKRAKVLQVLHPGAPPENPQPWHDTLGVAVQFGAACCVVELCTSSMLEPIPTANPAILELSQRIAEQIERRTVGVTSERIRRELIKCLQKGEPRRKEIATQLGMSERSLCRRLAEESTTFVHLLDALRREMAEIYIRQGSFKPTEITFALGFSDPSNFYRACKRWFGQMPNPISETPQPPW